MWSNGLHSLSKMVIILALLMGFTTEGLAQQDGSGGYSYKIGLGYGGCRDDLLVPLAFRGPGLFTGLSYTSSLGAWKFEVEGRFKFDFVFNRFWHPGAILSHDLIPRISRVISEGHRGRTTLGLSTPIESNNQFLFSWDDAHLYWLNIRSVQIDLSHQWKSKSDNLIDMKVSLPVLNFISRPKAYRYEKQDASLLWLGLYSPDEERDFKHVGMSQYQAYSLEISRKHQEKQVWWSLQLDYDHYTDPEDVWVSSISLIRSSKLSFRRDK